MTLGCKKTLLKTKTATCPNNHWLWRTQLHVCHLYMKTSSTPRWCRRRLMCSFFKTRQLDSSFNRHKQPSITGIFAEWSTSQRSNNSINKRVIKRRFQRGAEAVVQNRKSAPSLQLSPSRAETAQFWIQTCFTKNMLLFWWSLAVSSLFIIVIH